MLAHSANLPKVTPPANKARCRARAAAWGRHRKGISADIGWSSEMKWYATLFLDVWFFHFSSPAEPELVQLAGPGPAAAPGNETTTVRSRKPFLRKQPPTCACACATACKGINWHLTSFKRKHASCRFGSFQQKHLILPERTTSRIFACWAAALGSTSLPLLLSSPFHVLPTKLLQRLDPHGRRKLGEGCLRTKYFSLRAESWVADFFNLYEAKPEWLQQIMIYQ